MEQPTTPNSQLFSNSLYTTLKSKIAASPYASQISIVNYIQRQGTTDTWNNFLNDRNDLCEMIVISGHGSPGYWFFYDTPSRVDSKSFGNYSINNYTKWVFSYACCVMQPLIPKSNYSGSTDYTYMMQWFNNAFCGLHGMFGFASDVWGATKYSCGFLWLQTCYITPDCLWDQFFTNWVTQKVRMHYSWFQAVDAKLFMAMDFSGVIPVAYGSSVNCNGSCISGIDETIDKVYSGPMPHPSGYGCVPPTAKYEVFGQPQF